jgi:hypothetical protein
MMIVVHIKSYVVWALLLAMLMILLLCLWGQWWRTLILAELILMVAVVILIRPGAAPSRSQSAQSALVAKRPALHGPVPLPETVAVKQLAILLGAKPYVLINDLMDIDVFVNMNSDIEYEHAAQLVIRYGGQPFRTARR